MGSSNGYSIKSPCIIIKQCKFVSFQNSPGLFLIKTTWAILKIASNFQIFLQFDLCFRFADVLKYRLNNYLDKSATYVPGFQTVDKPWIRNNLGSNLGSIQRWVHEL